MQTSIKIRRAWNTLLVAVPLDELAVTALNDVTGVRSAKLKRIDSDGVVVAYEWVGDGPPQISDEALKRFGLSRCD